jgi:hypothetical protein
MAENPQNRFAKVKRFGMTERVRRNDTLVFTLW